MVAVLVPNQVDTMGGEVVVEIARILKLELSATSNRPLALSMAILKGEKNAAVGPGPSTHVAEPVPPSVVITVVARLTARILWPLVSAKYTALAAGSYAQPRG